MTHIIMTEEIDRAIKACVQAERELIAQKLEAVIAHRETKRVLNLLAEDIRSGR